MRSRVELSRPLDLGDLGHLGAPKVHKEEPREPEEEPEVGGDASENEENRGASLSSRLETVIDLRPGEQAAQEKEKTAEEERPETRCGLQVDQFAQLGRTLRQISLQFEQHRRTKRLLA